MGGIRTAADVNEILEGGQADMVGIGRPFYAEPDLAPASWVGRRGAEVRVLQPLRTAQMLGMKGVCYTRQSRNSDRLIARPIARRPREFMCTPSALYTGLMRSGLAGLG